MVIESLIEFSEGLKKNERDYFHMAMSTFYVEGLFFWDYNIEEDDIDMREVFKKIPEDLIPALDPCAWEFFFSNNYRSLRGERWNVIDTYLQRKGEEIRSADRDYVTGLRDSYMGLYEVTDIVPEKSITLKSLIKGDEGEIVVKEKKGTRQLVKWDVLGARIVHTKKNAQLAGGILVLTREAAKKAKESIENISSLMMERTYLESIGEGDPNPALTVKKMWVKEIVAEWFSEQMKRRQEPTFLNFEGDPIEQVTITFPMLATRKEVEKILNELPELVRTEKNEWLWPHAPKKKSLKNEPDNPVYLETQFTYAEKEESFSIFATLKIKGKLLTVEVNSQKRAKKAINFIQMIFNEKLGKPQTETETHEAILEISREKQKKIKSKVNKQEHDQLIKDFSKSYYDRWIDMPIPALSNKTPRETCKTKSGRDEVVELLKEFKSKQERMCKLQGEKMYFDFQKICDELGIENL